MSRQTAQQKKTRLKAKIRSKVFGSAQCPRLCVFRSNNWMYAQLIDDTAGATICAANDRTSKKGSKKMDGAIAVGKSIAALAKTKGITTVVFDRSGFKYAGRVKALADAARDEGLKF